MTMFAPHFASWIDASLPMPLFPPVIRTHFPVRSILGIVNRVELQPLRDWIWQNNQDGCAHGEPTFLSAQKLALMLLIVSRKDNYEDL